MAPATVERPGAWHRKAEPSDAPESYAALPDALARCGGERPVQGREAAETDEIGVVIAQRFASNLVALRKAAALSQEELGVRASLHRTEISQLERGLRLPRVDTVLKLAASLDAIADDLLAGIEWQPGETHYGQFREGDG